MVDLFVEAWEFQTFRSKQGIAINRELEEYYAAFLQPYGIASALPKLHAGPKNDFLDMGRTLAREIVARHSIEDVDLLLLAHDTPNTLQPLGSVTASLLHELNIDGPGFGISEQGTAAPFIALSLAKKYATQGKCTKALVFVLDQTTLPYELDPPVHGQFEDCGLVLVLGTETEAGLRLRKADSVFIDSDADDASMRVADAVTRYLAENCPGRSCRVILNEALARALAGHDLAVPLLIADAAFMSTASLLALCRTAVSETAEEIVLIHLGADGQLYFLLFGYRNALS